MRRRREFACDENGAMLLEFSLSIWTLFLVTFLIFEFCLVLYTYSVLGNAAREGVRYAIVHGANSTACSGPGSGCSDPSGANVTASVKDYARLSFHDIRGMTVTPSWPDGTATPSSRVVVTISYPYIAYLTVPGFHAPNMQVIAEGRVVF